MIAEESLPSSSDESEIDLYVNSLNDNDLSQDNWIETLKLGENELKIKLYICSSCNVISKKGPKIEGRNKTYQNKSFSVTQ